MALPLNNNAEGGTSGTTVTAANSGGASGDAFDSISIGTSAAFTFDNAQAAHGTLGYKYVEPATAVNISAAWTTAFGSQTTVFGRFYFYSTANPTGSLRAIRLFVAGVLKANFNITTGGKLEFKDTATTTTSTGVAIALSAWNRVEFQCTVSAGAATLEMKLWKTADSSGAADDTITVTNGNTGSVAFDQIRFGISGFATNYTFWLDDLNVNSTGYPGPVVAAGRSLIFNERQYQRNVLLVQ